MLHPVPPLVKAAFLLLLSFPLSPLCKLHAVWSSSPPQIIQAFRSQKINSVFHASYLFPTARELTTLRKLCEQTFTPSACQHARPDHLTWVPNVTRHHILQLHLGCLTTHQVLPGLDVLVHHCDSWRGHRAKGIRKAAGTAAASSKRRQGHQHTRLPVGAPAARSQPSAKGAAPSLPSAGDMQLSPPP